MNKNNQIFQLQSTLSQKIILFSSILIGYILVYILITNLIVYFVDNSLNGKVYNKQELRGQTFDDDKLVNRINNDESIRKDDWKKIRKVNPYGNWAVDLYLNTDNNSRYWFQPIFSFSTISLIFSIFLTTLFTSLIPLKYGYFHHKILREIHYFLERIDKYVNGSFSNHSFNELKSRILSANPNELRELANEWKVSYDDLEVLQNAIQWEQSGIFYRTLHVVAGIKLYFRNHFTEKYSNTILGLVYMGAAFLIIIIGLRGLKFIPSSEPSLVFFALGLEFTILITYAFTLMFSRPEDQSILVPDKTTDAKTVASKQMENLLRSFLKWK
jgi:hypothetical protein